MFSLSLFILFLEFDESRTNSKEGILFDHDVENKKKRRKVRKFE